MHPTHKISRTRKRKRRAHHALRAVVAVACPNCGSAKLPHAACANCGYVRPGLTLQSNEEE